MKTKLPAIPTKDQSLAKSSLKALKRITETRKRQSKPVELTYAVDGSEITIPDSALDYFQKILQSLSEGKKVEVHCEHSELTTQQAADYLNVSRPFVVKLMETGKLPFVKVGRHRRVKFSEVKKYEKRRNKKVDENLKELAKLSQEMNLGY